VDLTLKLLALGFGPLSEAIQTRVRGAQDAQLEAVVERMLKVHTLIYSKRPSVRCIDPQALSAYGRTGTSERDWPRSSHGSRCQLLG
jgi:hypothetical protein